MDSLPFEEISITGRVAFGITCLEYLCEAWKVKNQKMKELIDILWTFTSSNDLDIWDKQTSKILPDYDYEVPYKFGFEFLSREEQKTLTNVILEVIEIGGANAYGGFRSEYTMRPTLNIIKMLEVNNIILPNIKPFERSKVTEFYGWGNRVDKSFFKDYE